MKHNTWLHKNIRICSVNASHDFLIFDNDASTQLFKYKSIQWKFVASYIQVYWFYSKNLFQTYKLWIKYFIYFIWI